MKAPEDKSWQFCLNIFYNSSGSSGGAIKIRSISRRIHHKRNIKELNWKLKPQQSQTISCYHGWKWCKKWETERQPLCQTLIERLSSCCDVRWEGKRKGIWNIVPVECGTVAVRLSRCSENINARFYLHFDLRLSQTTNGGKEKKKKPHTLK